MTHTYTICGHRGARNEAPENTLDGFRYAVDLGLLSVEFDVQLSADDQLVVIHDDRVDRTTNGTGAVADLTVDELQQLDARSTFAGWPNPCPVPTLSDVLDTVGHMRDITIEVKSNECASLDRLVPQVIEEIIARDLTDRATMTSFDPRALEIAQRIWPEGRRGLTANWNDQETLGQALELGCCRADVYLLAAETAVVRAARDEGLDVMVWTVNTEAELARAIALDPDIICTDIPGTLTET